MLDKTGESSYNNRAKQRRYGITHLTPAQQVTGGSDGNFPIERVYSVRMLCVRTFLFLYFCIQISQFPGGVFHRNHDPRDQ